MAQRNKQNHQLKMDNNFFELVCNLSQDAILVVDRSKIVRYANPSVAPVLGKPIADIVGKNIDEVFPEFAQKWETFRSDRSYPNYDDAQYCTETQRWLVPVVQHFEDQSFFYIHDVTDVRKSHNSIRKQEALLRGITQNILDGIVTIDLGGTITTFNPAAEELTGYSAKEIIGKNIAILMSKEHGVNHDDYVRRFADSGRQNEDFNRAISVKRKDGSFFPAEIAVSRVQVGDEAFFVASLYDVSEIQKREERIRELARFPEETWNPVLKISADGVLTYTNTRCEPLLRAWNVRLNDRMPKNIRDVIEESMRNKRAVDVEVDCGGGQFFSVLFAPVSDLKAVYVYGRDVSIQKAEHIELLNHRNHLEEMIKARTHELEEARDEANRASKAKSIFLANMSHEIRTPLTSVIGYSEHLLDQNTTAEEKAQAINTIIRSSHHLKNIINDILDLSKIEAEKLEVERIPVNIFELLADVHSIVDAQARSNDLSFKIDYEYPLPKFITSDPIRLKQILINVCGNAVKFTQHGSVTIKVYCRAKQQKLLFDVIDTGIGISPEQHKRLFKAFSQADSTTTRQYGGTGLGLVLSKQLSIMLGGDLSVTSEAGKGSCFTLSVATGTLAENIFTHDDSHMRMMPTAEVKQETPSLEGEVLLVEDTLELQQLISYQIGKTGATITIAANGQQAVEKALAKHYDLIYMDMQMPIMDGYTAVKTLRSVGYTRPIVAMTANAMREDREKCMAAGCDDFISKPLKREQLYDSLSHYLNKNHQKESDALISDLIKEEPEMIDLVKKFLDILPTYIQQCREANELKDWATLKAILHKVKGMGGGYGYHSITDTAAIAEHKVKENDFFGIEPLLDQLEKLYQRALQGLPAQ